MNSDFSKKERHNAIDKLYKDNYRRDVRIYQSVDNTKAFHFVACPHWNYALHINVKDINCFEYT